MTLAILARSARDKLTGNAKWPASVTTGMSPAPSSALDDSDAGLSATYSVTTDGVLTDAILTIVVQSAIEAEPGYSVSKGADIDNATTGLRQTAIKAALGGSRVEIVRGCEGAFAAATCQFRGFNTHSGTFRIAHEDDNNPTTLRDLELRGVQRCIVDKPRCRRSAGGGSQNVFQINVFYDASHGVPQDITINQPDLGCDSATVTEWTNAIAITGATPAQGEFPANNIDIVGGTISRARQGVSWQQTTNCGLTGLTLTGFSANAFFAGGAYNHDLTIEENLVLGCYFNSAEPDQHRDAMQVGSTSVDRNWQRIKIRRNGFFAALGDAIAQGMFSNDVGYSGYNAGTGKPTGPAINGSGDPRLTGYQFADCELSNNAYDMGMAAAIFLDLGTGWKIDRNTIYRGELKNVTIHGSDFYSDGAMRSDTVTETVSGATHTAIGTSSLNVLPGKVGCAGIVATDDIILGASGLSTTAHNEAARMAWLTAGFADPGNDDPLIASLPKLIGALVAFAGATIDIWNNVADSVTNA